MKMNELEPMTIEIMRNLSPDDRYDALKLRHEWLKRQRAEDRREIRNIQQRIEHHINREQIRESRKLTKIKYIKLGLCVACGHKKPSTKKFYKTCLKCRKKANEV
jgi:hypothetical protein